MPTFGKVTYEQFREEASSFLRMAAKGATVPQLEAGCRSLTRLYMGLEDGVGKQERDEGKVLLDMAYRELTFAEFARLGVKLPK